MKKLISGLILSAMLMLSSFMVTSCSTPPTPQQAAIEQQVITGGVADATVLILNKNPQYKPDFIAGAAILSTLANGTNTITPQVVDAALVASGETNVLVNALIINGITSLDNYAPTVSTNSSVQLQVIQTGAGWVVAGVNQGVSELQ